MFCTMTDCTAFKGSHADDKLEVIERQTFSIGAIQWDNYSNL
jgi:hypothetical protein